jgi:putative transposase
LALPQEERQKVLDHLRSPRFVDAAPRQVWAQLLDEDDEYLCSVRTMYRYLEAEGETRERRNQLRHPSYTKPELLATAPNEVWSWDITKLKGPTKWSYFYLYVILDIFSRYVVGWMIAHRESKTLARKLIRETTEKHGIAPDQLTVHADRGSSMTSKPVARLLAELGITKTHSRPYTSSDNPYSEAHFKTLKYRPEFPERFGSFQDADAHCKHFVRWYNTQHSHTGLALLTPEDVHYGRAEQILHHRAKVLQAAFDAHPNRFKGRRPHPGKLPEAVWINPPAKTEEKLH